MSGGFGANSTQPCLYCEAKNRDMNSDARLLMNRFSIDDISELPRRKEVSCLRGKADLLKLQKGNSFNMMGLKHSRPKNFVPPALQMFLGSSTSWSKFVVRLIVVWNPKFSRLTP